jgi:hypothetical protein
MPVKGSQDPRDSKGQPLGEKIPECAFGAAMQSAVRDGDIKGLRIAATRGMVDLAFRRVPCAISSRPKRQYARKTSAPPNRAQIGQTMAMIAI